MKLLILITIAINCGTASARTRPFGGLDHPNNNDVNEISTSSVELPPDFAEKLLMEINRIRICHNAISTGPVVNDACFDDDYVHTQNVHKHVRRSGQKMKKSKQNGKPTKTKNRRSKHKRSERRRKRNRNQSDE